MVEKNYPHGQHQFLKASALPARKKNEQINIEIQFLRIHRK